MCVWGGGIKCVYVMTKDKRNQWLNSKYGSQNLWSRNLGNGKTNFNCGGRGKGHIERKCEVEKIKFWEAENRREICPARNHTPFYNKKVEKPKNSKKKVIPFTSKLSPSQFWYIEGW